MRKQPNIIYIHSHDTGRYIQPYGFGVPTPAMQKLAEEGVLFRKAFCIGPTCSPSRAALLTGECPHSNGMFGLAHRGWGLKDYKKHIVHTLRDAGYESTLIGFQHVAPWDTPEVIGYDNVIKCEGNRAPGIAEKTKEFLARTHEQPFFLSVGISHTHRFGEGRFSDEAETQGDPRYCRPPAPLPNTPETRQDMADFIDAARIYDQAVGDILDSLEENGLADNSLVILTTDHGIPFPNMKCSLYDHGTGVMLIMRGPANCEFRNGKVIDAMVTHMDIFPSICDVLDIPKPEWLQGKSLLPLVAGEADKLHDTVFGEISYHGGNKFVFRSARTERYKYIRHYSKSVDQPYCCDNGISKEFWNSYNWQDQPVPEEQLFDLIFDPNETNNLADQRALADIKQTLKNSMENWMQETADPLLLDGDVPEPGKTI